MTVGPIAVYRGSDPTNEELRTIPDSLFAPCRIEDDPTPLQMLLYPPHQDDV